MISRISYSPPEAPFFKCLNFIRNFGSCRMWTYNNGDLEWPLTCLMNSYYKSYVHILGHKKYETQMAKRRKVEKVVLQKTKTKTMTRTRTQRKMNTKHHIHREKGGVAEQWLNCGRGGAGGGKRLKITQNDPKIWSPNISPQNRVCIFCLTYILHIAFPLPSLPPT